MNRQRNILKEVEFPDFPLDEYKLRISNAQKIMKKRGIDALVLFNLNNIRYFAGFDKTNFTNDEGWRRSVIVPAAGKPVALAPQEIYQNFSLTTWVEEIRPFAGPEHLKNPPDHHTLLLETLKDLGLQNGRVATELSHTMLPDLSFIEYERIKKDLPNMMITDAADQIWEQRMIKTEWEKSLRRDLCKKSIRSFKKAVGKLREGMTRKEFHAEICKIYIEEGLHSITYGSHSLCTGCLGVGAPAIMSFTDTKLNKGDMMLFDGGPIYKHYFTDFQRNFIIGEPSKKILTFYEKVLKGQKAALNAVKAGVKASEVYRIAEETLTKEGIKIRSKFAGHGIGLQNHEPPYLQADSDYILKKDMVLTVEVGSYDKDIINCTLMPEDILIVTENGCENLTQDLSHELFVAGRSY